MGGKEGRDRHEVKERNRTARSSHLFPLPFSPSIKLQSTSFLLPFSLLASQYDKMRVEQGRNAHFPVRKRERRHDRLDLRSRSELTLVSFVRSSFKTRKVPYRTRLGGCWDRNYALSEICPKKPARWASWFVKHAHSENFRE